MSKNVAPVSANVTKTEEKPVRGKKEKPGLAQNLIVLKALEGALNKVTESQDPQAIKIMSDYVRTQHRRMRAWAKIDVKYEEG